LFSGTECPGVLFFLFHRKLFFYEIKCSARIALQRIGGCRLCDPPQAENPAEQDSFYSIVLEKEKENGKGKEAGTVDYFQR
jgi:hypothetical protein